MVVSEWVSEVVVERDEERKKKEDDKDWDPEGVDHLILTIKVYFLFVRFSRVLFEM